MYVYSITSNQNTHILIQSLIQIQFSCRIQFHFIRFWYSVCILLHHLSQCSPGCDQHIITPGFYSRIIYVPSFWVTLGIILSRILHVIFTLLFMFIVLRVVEKKLGWLRTSFIYILSGIGGYIVSAVFVPYYPEVRITTELVSVCKLTHS